MNYISNYFDKSSKKRGLSGDLNPEEERKKVRKRSSKTQIQMIKMQLIPLMSKFFKKLVTSQKYS